MTMLPLTTVRGVWPVAALAFLLILASAPLMPAAAADTAGDWRVTLLKPKDCQACSILEESLKRRGTLQQVALSDGAGTEVTAVIERRPGGSVTAEEWQEMLQLPYFDQGAWQRASEHGVPILLKRDGHVVSAGDINDSSDLRNERFPTDLTVPLAGSDVLRVRAAYASYFQDLFIKNWNLDWFFRLARDPSMLAARRFDNWVERQPRGPAPQLGTANVLLAATGYGASDNPVFNAIRSEEIEQVLTRDLGVDAAQIQVRYGAGALHGFNAVEQTPTGLRFVRREVPRATAFTMQSLTEFFDGVRAQPSAHNLIVLIGHGGPDGAPLWGQVHPLGPEEMRSLHQRGRGDDVLVSGNCFGGVLAQATSCGFFGARPDTVATGCQADAAEVAQSKDYLHVFFDAFTDAKRADADANHDGIVTFEEAHWYAVRHGDERNVAYSTVDALADAWFAAHPSDLPEDISLAELQQLAANGNAAEREALKALTRGLVGSHRFPLRDLAGQAARYSTMPTGPRPALGQLARRLLYETRTGKADIALAAARSCGDRSPAEFLKH